MGENEWSINIAFIELEWSKSSDSSCKLHIYWTSLDLSRSLNNWGYEQCKAFSSGGQANNIEIGYFRSISYPLMSVTWYIMEMQFPWNLNIPKSITTSCWLSFSERLLNNNHTIRAFTAKTAPLNQIIITMHVLWIKICTPVQMPIYIVSMTSRSFWTTNHKNYSSVRYDYKLNNNQTQTEMIAQR